MECQAWLSSGHDEGQCTPTSMPRSFTSTALQTDDPVTTICHLNASVQASEESEPPQFLSQPQQAIAEPLEWAEDARSLPTVPLLVPPLLHQLRDLSVLCSPSSSSFSSHQDRSKHFDHYSHQPHHHHFHSHFKFNPFYSPHHNSFKPAQSYFHTKTHSHLNWESDTCLSDLSHSLKALGWIHAH